MNAKTFSDGKDFEEMVLKHLKVFGERQRCLSY